MSMSAAFDPALVYRACNRVLRYKAHIYPPGKGLGRDAPPALWFVLAPTGVHLVGNLITTKAKEETYIEPVFVDGLDDILDSTREGMDRRYYLWPLNCEWLKMKAYEASKKDLLLLLKDRGYVIDVCVAKRKEAEPPTVQVRDRLPRPRTEDLRRPHPH